MKSTALYHSAHFPLLAGRFSNLTTYLLFFIALCLVIPIFDLPLLGLSLTAPLFFIITAEAVFRPPAPWSLVDRRYKILALWIWVGLFLSLVVNGLSSGGAAIDSFGVITVIRYTYWLFIFVLIIYVVTAAQLTWVLSRVLGWTALALALLRWGETAAYGNIGAWTGTHLVPQNAYGYLFSAFSPFLLVLILSEKKWKGLLAIFGNAILWGAVAINGSRGSWVAILVSIAIFLFVFLLSRPRKSFGALVLLTFVACLAYLIFSSSTQISQVVESRLSTFQDLDAQKTYLIRQLLNQKALRLFEQSPIFGVGAGRFRVSSVPLDIPSALRYADQSHFDVKSAHNSYLSFLAENGVVGAVPFGVLLLILAFRGMRSAISLTRQNQYWGLAIYSSFAGMSVHMWGISALTNTATWFIYAMVAAMIIIAQTEFRGEK